MTTHKWTMRQMNLVKAMKQFTVAVASPLLLKLSLPCVLLAVIPCAASAASLENGQKLYMVHCAGCHGMNGASVIPQAKDFSRIRLLTQPDQNLIDVIRSGRNMMPAYLGILNDREMLDVINYLRTFN